MRDYEYLVVLGKRILWAYGLLSGARFCFWFANQSLFPAVSIADTVSVLITGLRFDTTTLIYFNSLFFLMSLIPGTFKQAPTYMFIQKTVFVCANLFILLLNLIDTAYFPFSNKRSGMEFWLMQKGQLHLWTSYIQSHWYWFLIWIAVLAAVIRLYPKSKYTQTPGLIKEFIVFMLCIPLLGIAARGSFKIKPLNPHDAARLVRSELVPVALNTPFQMLFTLSQTGVERVSFFPDSIARRYYNPIHTHATDTAKPNIVLIIVESLGKEYMGYYNNGNGYTPFLDSLAGVSQTYLHAYANGKRSIEGIPSIVASMPSWMPNDYMNSFYASNLLDGTARYLELQGYDVSFYHGGKNGTMSFDNFIARTGGTYFGKNEYTGSKSDDDGFWGISDQPYLTYWAQELKQKRQPFFSTVFTLSSHHPYHLPASVRNKYPEGPLPIHKTVRYADDALRQFFARIQNQEWFRNTVFIITADHSAENSLEYYQTVTGRYEIPLLIYQQGVTPQHMTHTTQQLDIMPMILKRTGTPQFFSFGTSDTTHAFAMQYVEGVYQLIQWPYVYYFDGQNGKAMFNLEVDFLLKKNLIQTEPTQARYMDTLVKCVIQSYNGALMWNKTRLPESN